MAWVRISEQSKFNSTLTYCSNEVSSNTTKILPADNIKIKLFPVSLIQNFNTHLFTYYTFPNLLCRNLYLKFKHLCCLMFKTAKMFKAFKFRCPKLLLIFKNIL